MQSGPPGAQGGAPMQSGSPGMPGCQDVLDHSTFSASYGNVFMKYLVDNMLPPATPANGSCEGGCPFLRPLCNGTSCIRPSCADLVQAGMRCSGAKQERVERGKAQLAGECSLGEAGVDALTLAQSMCSATCGCSRVPAGDSGGCLPECIPAPRKES